MVVALPLCSSVPSATGVLYMVQKLSKFKQGKCLRIGVTDAICCWHARSLLFVALCKRELLMSFVDGGGIAAAADLASGLERACPAAGQHCGAAGVTVDGQQGNINEAICKSGSIVFKCQSQGTAYVF